MVFSFVWEKMLLKLSVAIARRPAERRLNPAGVGVYLQLNIQILYIFCIFFNKFTAGFNIIAH